MLYLLYGEDDFSSFEELEEIKKDFFKRNTAHASVAVLDFDENVKEDFNEAISSEGLFSSSKLVIVKNIFGNGNADIQDRVLKSLGSRKDIAEDKNTVVVFWERNSPKKSAKLFKFLSKEADSKKFEKMSHKKIASWINKKVSKLRGNISNGAVEKLIIFVGDDLWKMKNEVEKLVDYAEKREITEEDVDVLVSAKTGGSIFEAIDALAQKNKAKAIEMLHRQLEAGDDPFYILSMYVYQFRNLLKIGEFYFQGIRNNFDIAKIIKAHPFVVKKSIDQLRSFSLEELKIIYARLEKMDYQVKTGKIDIDLALDKFIAEL